MTENSILEKQILPSEFRKDTVKSNNGTNGAEKPIFPTSVGESVTLSPTLGTRVLNWLVLLSVSPSRCPASVPADCSNSRWDGGVGCHHRERRDELLPLPRSFCFRSSLFISLSFSLNVAQGCSRGQGRSHYALDWLQIGRRMQNCFIFVNNMR